MTANDLISSAMRLIGALAAGEPISTDDAPDALMVLQQMIDGWNADSLAIFTTGSNDFPLVLGQQTYTIGSGGDFNIPRPARIDSVSSIILDNPDTPVEIPMAMYSWEEWQTQIPVKNVSGSFPQVCYDGGEFPLRNLNFWPIPSSVNAVRIYSWTPLSAPTTFGTVISFPPGYAEAFRYNLAVRLANEYGKAVPPAVGQVAVESFARIKTMNAPDLMLRSDLMLPNDCYNWSADMFGNPYQ